jgi:hypothetical protein
VVASIGAGLTAITGLAGFGIGLAAGQATQSDHAQHLMMAGPGFDGPGFDGRHHGDHRDEMNRR